MALTEALRIADVESARAEQRRRIEAGERRLLGIGMAAYVEITGFGGSEFGSGRGARGRHRHRHVRHLVARPGARHQLLDDRVRPAGHPARRTSPTSSPTPPSSPGAAVRADRARSSSAATPSARPPTSCARRPSSSRRTDAGGGPGRRGARGRRASASPASRTPGSTWKELATYAHEHDGGLGVATTYTQHGATFPFGAHVSIVEVDTDTGRVRPLRHVAVDDCGRILNPLIVAGQQHGGAIQGICQALWEEMVYDEPGHADHRDVRRLRDADRGRRHHPRDAATPRPRRR